MHIAQYLDLPYTLPLIYAAAYEGTIDGRVSVPTMHSTATLTQVLQPVIEVLVPQKVHDEPCK